MRISVLDQSPVLEDSSPAHAIQATIELAVAAEQLGYYRFWLAEHHNMRGLANPCPEILLSAIGHHTKKIRIGTGGVLLPYYSPLKVAETFNMLETLFPQRVDLGIGRAPGGDRLTASALNPNAFNDANAFPNQVVETLQWLDGSIPKQHPFGEIKAMPTSTTSPEVWLLGSSNYSSTLASHLGLPFAFAHFISAEGGEEASKLYRQNYTETKTGNKPYNMVCVSAICAKTEKEAEILAGPLDHRRLQLATGSETTLQTTSKAKLNEYTDHEKHIIEKNRARSIIGTPASVNEDLVQLAEAFNADELMILTMTGDYESRITSYELIAKTFN